jgi:hypothetical protein
LGIQQDFYSAGKGDIFSGEKRPDSESGSSLAFSDGAKYAWNNTPVPHAQSCHEKETFTSFVIYFVEIKTLLLGSNYTGA